MGRLVVLAIFFTFFIAGTAFGLFYLYIVYPTTSPINSVLYIIENQRNPHAMMNKQTLAFMPYWRLDDTQYTRFDLLSEINYFSLSVNSSGDFVKLIDKNAEPGWHSWNKDIVKDMIARTQITGGKFTFTVLMNNNDTIEDFLDNKQSQQNLINNITEQINIRRLNGVIIDVEYVGEPEQTYRESFTKFAGDLSKALRKNNPNTSLSLAILPLEARKKGLFDLTKLVPIFHRFIGMSYDYYAANADIAGPVAPMYGYNEKKFFFDVTTTYDDYLKVIPKNKLIMGIPYYGWDRTVTEGKTYLSETYPLSDENNYSAILSYGRMREDKNLVKSRCSWDDLAQEPWCWYVDKNKIYHQVWYENNKSVGIKYDYAKKMDFAGIAIWVLGYDKQYPDLWQIMENTYKLSIK